MKITYSTTLHKRLLPKFLEHLLEGDYTDIQINHDSVDHFKIIAERELTRDEIKSAGSGFLFQRGKGLLDGHGKKGKGGG